MGYAHGRPMQGVNQRIRACISVSGYFDMCVMNELDRFHLAGDVIDRVPKLAVRAAYAKQALRDKLSEHREYIRAYGDDMAEITGWRWKGSAAATGVTSTEGDNV